MSSWFCHLYLSDIFPKVGASTGYTVFVWLFGIFAGGYHYALKMFVFEKVRLLFETMRMRRKKGKKGEGAGQVLIWWD